MLTFHRRNCSVFERRRHELLDVESFTNTGTGNWADYVDLNIEATGTADALLRFNSGIPVPGNDTPSLLVPANGSSTVRVVPDDVYAVTAFNVDEGPTPIRVSAVGWTPALDEAMEAKREAREEEEVARLLAEGESLAGWQEPVLDEFSPLPDPVCNDDGHCIGFVGPGAESPFVLEGDGLSPASAEPINASFVSGRESSAKVSRAAFSSREEDAPLDCGVGALTGVWIVQDRFNACGNFDTYLLKPMYPPNLSSVIQMRTEQRAVLSRKTSEIRYTFRVTALQGIGASSALPYRAQVAVKCSICVGGDVPAKSTKPVVALPGLRQSPWVEQVIPVDVSVTDTCPITSVVIDPVDMDADPEYRIGLDWSFDIPYFPDFSLSAPIYLPLVRCDGGNRRILGTEKDRAKPGCVFPYAKTPILRIEPGPTAHSSHPGYPKHAELVRNGQSRVEGRPGDPSGSTPLIRIPVWEHPAPTPSNPVPSPKYWHYYTKNRSEAGKMCRNIGVRPLTCDEYPYAATTNGCYVAWVSIGPKCEVLGVPSRENLGAGGKLGAFSVQQRLLPGDGYYVDVTAGPVVE